MSGSDAVLVWRDVARGQASTGVQRPEKIPRVWGLIALENAPVLGPAAPAEFRTPLDDTTRDAWPDSTPRPCLEVFTSRRLANLGVSVIL